MAKKNAVYIFAVAGLALVLAFVLTRIWTGGTDGDGPEAIPLDTPMFSFTKESGPVVAPLPHEISFQVDGQKLVTLGMKPGRKYPKIALPDFPQLVEFDGPLPPARRVLFYSCKVNDRGLRGERVYTYSSSPDRFRIGVIGTGVTFGEGVEDLETYCAVLERRLNQAPLLKRTFEVINFGIPCMTTNYGLNAFIKQSRSYQVDFWVFALGVNDSLPMFRRPLEKYRQDVRRLMQQIQRSAVKAVMLVEPVNTFYPWMDKYRRYRAVLEQEVRGKVDLLNLEAILDCHERAEGLRLEVTGDLQQVVQYRGRVPRTLFQDRYRARPKQQYISPKIYLYLDTHKVWLRTFITDVHLNPLGHRVVAGTLYEYLTEKLKGNAMPDLVPRGCGVVVGSNPDRRPGSDQGLP